MPDIAGIWISIETEMPAEDYVYFIRHDYTGLSSTINIFSHTQYGDVLDCITSKYFYVSNTEIEPNFDNMKNLTFFKITDEFFQVAFGKP